jgi:molecular chaperone GrpE
LRLINPHPTPYPLLKSNFSAELWRTVVADKKPKHEEPVIDDEQLASETDDVESQDQDEPSLEEALGQLQADLITAKDDVLRAQADAQNVKRRAEQDVEKARKFALEQFCKELLPVIDNLERALEAAPADEPVVKPIAEGVELTLKSFADAFARFKIEAVNPLGEPFDPQFHQAMSMVENADVEPNTVTLVMQKGYTLHGRLVRPAMVMVSKAIANS